MKYYPFLKLKQNEVLALKELAPTILNELTPFFDIARPQKNICAESVITSISAGKSSLERHWDMEKPFYIDGFDIPDTIRINGLHAYKYILEQFVEFYAIPVIGLNRHPEHIQHAINFMANQNLSKIAIRLTPDDFFDFDLIEYDLNNLVSTLQNTSIDLVLDCRLIQDEESATNHIQSINDFLTAIDGQYNFNRIILTGSSISANIADHINTDEYMAIPRHEWGIFTCTANNFPTIAYGDYAIISPNYSDANIDPKLFRNVSTPKLFYTAEDMIHIFRGGSFKHSEDGQDQYFNLAEDLVSRDFYRQQAYSFGDGFIYEKSQRIGSPSSQGNWYKVLNNCHMTYICKDLL